MADPGTKTHRRALARGIREQLSFYLCDLTPHMEDHAREKGVNMHRIRNDRLKLASHLLGELFESEARS